MSFNIRTSTARDLRYAWDLRKHLVIERIHAFDPDLLGLQECHDGEQAQFVRQQLDDYAFLGAWRGADSRSGREMAPVLYRQAAFDLLDSGTFWLSSRPDEPGSKLFGMVYPRTVTWVRLLPQDGRLPELVFFNTHFDYMPLVLASSARLLRERILAITDGAPTILCGDFNTPAGGSAQRILTQRYEEAPRSPFVLADTMDGRREGDGLVGTIHKFGLFNRPLIIDWILASNHFRVVNSAVDDFEHHGLYPSDHFPVTATLAPRPTEAES